MKKLPLFLLLLAFISCGPSKYVVPVEMRHPSVAGVDLTGKVISVIYLDDDDAELAMKSQRVAESFAESLTKAGFASDDVKTYKLPVDVEPNYSSKDSMVSLLMHTGADFVFLLDKLESNRVTIKAYDAMDHKETVKSYAAAIEPDVTDMSHIGTKLSSSFIPQWKTEQFSIAYFEGERWYEALIKAEQCDWQGAMQIWMDLLKSNDSLKRSCAEYNIAVACYLLGDNKLASEWLDRSDAECELSLSSVLRKRIAK